MLKRNEPPVTPDRKEFLIRNERGSSGLISLSLRSERTFFNSLRPSSFAFGTPPARFGRPRIDSLATEKQFPELPQLKSGLVCSQQIPCGAHRHRSSPR